MTAMFTPAPPARVSSQLFICNLSGLTHNSTFHVVVSNLLIWERSTEYDPSVVPMSSEPSFMGRLLP